MPNIQPAGWSWNAPRRLSWWKVRRQCWNTQSLSDQGQVMIICWLSFSKQTNKQNKQPNKQNKQKMWLTIWWLIVDYLNITWWLSSLSSGDHMMMIWWSSVDYLAYLLVITYWSFYDHLLIIFQQTNKGGWLSDN